MLLPPFMPLLLCGEIGVLGPSAKRPRHKERFPLVPYPYGLAKSHNQ